MSEPATETLSTGIRNPRNPNAWLVPPWPADAGVRELVRHFQRFQPAIHACSAIQAAYYSRYAAILAATPTADLLDTFSWRWYEELLKAVHRSAESAEAEHEQALDSAQQAIQLTLVRTLGINSHPIEGQALGNDAHLDWRRLGRCRHGVVVPDAVGSQLKRWLAAMTDQTDPLLHYIPLLRKAAAMPEDDPQKQEDEHVKEVKKRTEKQTSNGR